MMIETIEKKIEELLTSLDIFKVVERSISKKSLQSPPSAGILLAFDKENASKAISRDLGWDIMLMIPALGIAKGRTAGNNYIDAVRNAFVDWRPLTTGGVMPAKVPMIRLEGIQGTMLVYSARVTMEAIPKVFAN